MPTPRPALVAARWRRHHPPLHEQEPPGWLTAAACLALALALLALSVAALTSALGPGT